MAAYKFAVGEVVGVMCSRYRPQGTYKVTKINGNVVELARESDGYVRTFSNRTGLEKSITTVSRYHSASIVTMREHNAVQDRLQKQKDRAALWSELREAVSFKDLKEIKRLTALLEGVDLN